MTDSMPRKVKINPGRNCGSCDQLPVQCSSGVIAYERTFLLLGILV